MSELLPGSSNSDTWNRMVASGAIDPNCPACIRHYGTANNPTPETFAPRHKASRGCESGSRPHCTCDRCF